MPHIVARYLGLAATTTMTVVSWWVGAMPAQRPAQLGAHLPLLTGSAWRVAGLVLWGIAALVLVACWWALGRAVRTGGLGPGATVVTAAIWAAPLLLAAPIASHDLYAYACQGQIFLAGADPYRVGPADLPCSWLTAVPVIWRDNPAPYGPAALLASAGAVWLSGQGFLVVAVVVLRLVAVAGLILLAVSLPRLAGRCGVEPAAALWLGLANPVIVIHLVGGGHHDALMVGLAVAGLAAAAHGRGLWSGVALGVAVAVKATAVIVIPFALLLLVAAARPGGGRFAWVPALRAVAVVGAGAVGSFAALTVATGLDLGWLGALPVARQPVSWLSVPTGVATAAGALLAPFGVPSGTTVDIARAVALYVLLPITVVALWWRAARALGVATAVAGAGAALAATVLLAPVAYPWYLAAPVAVLAAVLTGRAPRYLALVTAVTALVVLPTSKNLAISTLWVGAAVELIAVTALAVYVARRRLSARAPA